MSFNATMEAARRELGEFGRLVDGLSEEDWARPTRCEGWTVADLVAHVGDAASYQGEALHRALSGSMEVPDVPEHRPASPEEAAERFRAGRDHLEAAFEAVGAEHSEQLVPLPFAVVPASIAAIVILIEYGVHRNDLEWALGDERPLADDVATAMVTSLPGFLPMIETTPPGRPLAFRLEAPSTTLGVVSDGEGWTVTDNGDAPTCVISGDDSTVALFALGRIPADAVSVSGDAAEEAASFKRYFPGP